MHEISLCESIIELVTERARSAHCKRVRSIRLQIGTLSCVEASAMHFAFEAVARGTIAEGARLQIDSDAGTGWCQQCLKLVAIQERYDSCPECGAAPLEIRSGESMRVIDMEVQ